MSNTFFRQREYPVQAVISIADVKPSYKRIVVRAAGGVPKANWVCDSVIEAFHVQQINQGYENSALMAVAASQEEQSLFDDFEIDFVILLQYVEFFGLGYVQDVRLATVPADQVEVAFALDGPRLCMHALSADGLTRLYVARVPQSHQVEFRLEFFSQEGDFEEVRTVIIPEDELEDEPRPALLTWMLSCLTGPLRPAPIGV